MNKEQFIKIMDAIIKRYNTLNKLYDKTARLIGDCDRLIEVTNLEPIIDAVADIVGDDGDWIYWYIIDNDCGKSDNSVFSKDGDRLPSETLEDLWNLINITENEKDNTLNVPMDDIRFFANSINKGSDTN